LDEYGNCLPIPLVNAITPSQTWSTNKSSPSIAIPAGVTLTITATVFSLNYPVTIKSGGKLILSGGTIYNGYVIAQNGSELTISNNGKILLGNNKNLDIQSGAKFDLTYGEVLTK
jgi:hypothetical protein